MLQAVARQGAEAVSVRLDARSGQTQAQLDGFKSRALRAVVRVQERRWHYEIEWSCLPHESPSAAGRLEVLIIGGVHLSLAARGHSVTQTSSDSRAMLSAGQWDIFVITSSLPQHSSSGSASLRRRRGRKNGRPQ